MYATAKVGNAILAKMAKDGFRQRVGQEEAFFGERYKNYLEWLKQKVSNPLLSGMVPAVFVGGVLRDSVEWYDTHPHLMNSVFYRGQHSGKHDWAGKYDCNRYVDCWYEPSGYIYKSKSIRSYISKTVACAGAGTDYSENQWSGYMASTR